MADPFPLPSLFQILNKNSCATQKLWVLEIFCFHFCNQSKIDLDHLKAFLWQKYYWSWSCSLERKVLVPIPDRRGGMIVFKFCDKSERWQYQKLLCVCGGVKVNYDQYNKSVPSDQCNGNFNLCVFMKMMVICNVHLHASRNKTHNMMVKQ
jgi:hypothetical protein